MKASCVPARRVPSGASYAGNTRMTQTKVEGQIGPGREEFDPMAPDEIARRVRNTAGNALFALYSATGAKPTAEQASYFRDVVEDEQAYEAAVQRRLDGLAAAPLVYRPIPLIRKIG